jgi:hypothetical protein
MSVLNNEGSSGISISISNSNSNSNSSNSNSNSGSLQRRKLHYKRVPQDWSSSPLRQRGFARGSRSLGDHIPPLVSTTPAYSFGTAPARIKSTVSRSGQIQSTDPGKPVLGNNKSSNTVNHMDENGYSNGGWNDVAPAASIEADVVDFSGSDGYRGVRRKGGKRKLKNGSGRLVRIHYVASGSGKSGVTGVRNNKRTRPPCR